MQREKILVTSALPYANGPIHLGHLSGAYLPADIFVRYHRSKGSDILYVCGSDEHGVPITISADKEGVSPKEIIDRYHEANKKAFEKFDMSFDVYSRTSRPIHHETAQTFFKSYLEQKLLIEKKSFQFYDDKAQMFLPDRYVEGTCPKCGFEEARSDECENCGSLYDPSELIKPRSKISGEEPLLKETSHWYFPLGKFQDRLEKYVNESNEKYKWKDNVIQYCRGWFRDGLKDRAVTRDLDWGVKVPINGADGKVLYVWFEAVLGYISATKEFFKAKGNEDGWKDFWQDTSTRYIAFIGKDNTVFHTIIFPAMLMAWNDGNKEKYLLPENVPANEFLNFEGKKFSKSRGWGIDVSDFLELFPADSLRYTLASNLPENKDTDFHWKEFQAKNNSELADILGNFVNRTFVFARKHFGNKVPALGELQKIDSEMIDMIKEYPVKIGSLIENYKIKDAVLEMMNLARAANKYFNDTEPWVTIKSNKDKCGTTINVCVQIISTLAEVFGPVIPDASGKMFRMLNTNSAGWVNCGTIRLFEGHELGTPEILFSKVDDEIISEQINKLGVVEQVSYNEPMISYEEFSKIDLRTAVVLEAEKIKKSKKLLKLKVKTAGGERQIIAGIAEHYSPDELLNKSIVIVANLKPAKLMGLESQGMILAVENKDGELKILQTDDKIVPGAKVR
ncbi:MAG: methionine--tRNA ligase [Melioribacteraceae bacterium]|nr:methionine--tRNA ligase [Melioribacteraceae bacterium]